MNTPLFQIILIAEEVTFYFECRYNLGAASLDNVKELVRKSRFVWLAKMSMKVASQSWFPDLKECSSDDVADNTGVWSW